VLLNIASLAIADAEGLDRNGHGLRVEVTDLPPDEAAEAVINRTSWPASAHAHGSG
jgi:hypothetical protein